jgi:hypothetical protein
MKQPHDGDSGLPPGDRRPPDYVIVVSASDWIKEHFPAAGADPGTPRTPAKTAAATPSPTWKPNRNHTRK